MNLLFCMDAYIPDSMGWGMSEEARFLGELEDGDRAALVSKTNSLEESKVTIDVKVRRLIPHPSKEQSQTDPRIIPQSEHHVVRYPLITKTVKMS
jgi:hypothetical protein